MISYFLLPLPELPHSERRIPPWVLSSVVLRRLAEMLERLARRFVAHRAISADDRDASRVEAPNARSAVGIAGFNMRLFEMKISQGTGVPVPVT